MFRKLILDVHTYRDFSVLQVSRIFLLTCMSMLSVALGWHIYDLTNSALLLGLMGLSIFLPKVVFAIIGGDFADRYNRLRLINISLFGIFLGVTALWLCARADFYGEPRLIFLFVAFNSAAYSLGSPSGSSILTHLVPREKLSRAVALAGSIWQFSAISGPALGGFIYAIYGSAVGVYGWCSALAGGGFLLSLLIRKPEYRYIATGNIWSRVMEGAHFVFSERVLLGAISLDLFAVLFGGAVALMPIYARDILGLGPTGLGFLRSCPAVGAGIVAIWLAVFPIKNRAGMKMYHAVFWFGVATILFAVSRNIALSAFALVVLGGADMISVVIRHTLEQTRTPAHMRGRVSAVNQIFIGASNELGEFESGLTAHWFGVVPAAILGGVCTLAVLFRWKKIFPELFETDKI